MGRSLEEERAYLLRVGCVSGRERNKGEVEKLDETKEEKRHGEGAATRNGVGKRVEYREKTSVEEREKEREREREREKL